MLNNLTKNIIENGGSVHNLLIDSELTQGQGLCNPSICKINNEILVNIRNVGYTLYHSENQQKFPSAWGPLSYLHREDDMHLRTTNFLCKLNSKTFEIIETNKVDTSLLDVDPLWDFVGLEDARITNWDDNLYLIGVRRDTTTNGEGRMEYSEIFNNREIKRTRIEPPISPSYCEKNWMPIMDMPHHFVKWTNPTEIVEANLNTKTSVRKHIVIPPHFFPRDLRGGSQVIPYKGYHIALTHEVELYNNDVGMKDGQYYHRFIVWDKDWNIVKFSEDFKFFSSNIEFACGIMEHEGDLLVTLGLQDSSAYLIRIPLNFFDKLVGIEEHKLYGLPTVNYISFEDDNERRINLENELMSHNLNFIPHISTKEDDINSVINGHRINELDKRGLYCLMSHLRAIKKWYNQSNEEYGLFIEDDVSFETVKYWKFNWEEFFYSIDENWDALQLVVINENNNDTIFNIQPRRWYDWSVTSYVITRKYAKYLIDRFYKFDEFTIYLNNDILIPIVENVIFNEGKVLSFPLFIENPSTITTTYFRNNEDVDVNDREYNQKYHNLSSEFVLNWWKNNNISFKKPKKPYNELLYLNIFNPYNELTNFNMGEYFLKKGQLSSSLSYFLRTAEYSELKNITYESLLKIGIILGRMGNRPHSEKTAYLTTISFDPSRPEGYSYLCLYNEYHKNWFDVYSYAKIGEMLINNKKETLTDVNYPGDFIFKFEQAVSLWYIGRTKESQNLFLELYNDNISIPNYYKEIIKNNLLFLGYSFESNSFVKK